MAISIQEAAKIAKTKTTDRRWLNAIDRAVEGSATWIVTELHDCLLITSDSGETYRVNGHCTCRAGVIGQPCKHLAYRRLREIAATETAPADERAAIIADIKSTWPIACPGLSLADGRPLQRRGQSSLARQR
jgi:hypothetical protein